MLNDKVQQREVWTGNCPAVLRMFLYTETMVLCNFLIAAVMVEVPGTAGIFDAIFSGVAVAHLVQQRCASLFNGTAQCCAADIDLIAILVTDLPNLSAGKVTISTDSLFQTDNDLGQLAVEKTFVQRAKHLF